MNRPKERKTLRDTEIQPLGTHAVFTQQTRMAAAKFVCLHENYESASAEAIRLMTAYVQADPSADRVFYVVEIVACFRVDPTSGLRAEEKTR